MRLARARKAKTIGNYAEKRLLKCGGRGAENRDQKVVKRICEEKGGFGQVLPLMGVLWGVFWGFCQFRAVRGEQATTRAKLCEREAEENASKL